MELDETNNCIESFYPAGIEIKVDVQDGGECFDMGEQFLVNVDVDPRNIPVYGVQYTLSFNNSALHGEWQNEGTFLNSDGATTTVVINTIDNGAGTISFAATRTDIQTGVTDLLLEAGGIKAYGVDDGEFYYFIIVVMMYTASLGVGSSSMHRTRN